MQSLSPQTAQLVLDALPQLAWLARADGMAERLTACPPLFDNPQRRAHLASMSVVVRFARYRMHGSQSAARA